jgi:hypothetical protein
MAAMWRSISTRRSAAARQGASTVSGGGGRLSSGDQRAFDVALVQQFLGAAQHGVGA